MAAVEAWSKSTNAAGLVPNKVMPRMNLADDFSPNSYPSGTREYLLHDPSPDGFGHGFLGRVSSEGQMKFSVRAEGDRAQFGSGSDMFDSFMLRARNDGVSINSVAGEWHIGTDSVNAAQYLKAVESGLSPQQAALSTWTGRIATRHGYTDVYVPEIQAGVVRPVFTRPAQVKP